MYKVHNYQGLDSRQKSGQETEQAISMNNRFTRSGFKTKSSFNNSTNVNQIALNINHYKAIYFSKLDNYYQMRLLEQLGDQYSNKGIAPIDQKIELLKDFHEIITAMQDSLANMLLLIKQVDFNIQNFEEVYKTDADYLSETIFRDIKYIQQQHNDFLFQSSLRYLPSVLEVLELDHFIEIEEFDINLWAQNGFDYLSKFNGIQFKRNYRNIKKSFWRKYCCCFKNTIVPIQQFEQQKKQQQQQQ